MALLTAGGKVGKSVAAVFLPIPDMVDMQDGMVFDPPPAEYTGVMISGEDRFPECLDPIPLSPLILHSFRRLLSTEDRL